MSHGRRLITLAFALVIAGCSSAPLPPAPAARELREPPAPAISAAPPAAPTAPEPTVSIGPSAAASVGPDDAPGKRERVATAVLLFGTVGLDERQLRFVPVVCAIDGKLATGKACGAAMPASARVRTTRADVNLPATLTVARSTRDFIDKSTGQTYRAPEGPACCMYNTCVGETIPYSTGRLPGAAPKRVLAVWPDTADIALEPRARSVEGVAITDGPWLAAREPRLDQAVRVAGRQIVSGRSPAQCGSCGAAWIDAGNGWAPLDGSGWGVGGYDILATSDVDGDGRPEAILYEEWRNDYGLKVLGNDWSKPTYRFSCGNI